jgi:hypothetical protein
MATKTVRIDGEITESLGGLAVRATRLRGGLREGVLEIELVAGSNRVIVLPDRGLGIWKMDVGGVELGWQSPCIRGSCRSVNRPGSAGSTGSMSSSPGAAS